MRISTPLTLSLWSLLLPLCAQAEIVTLTASGVDLGNGNYATTTNSLSIEPFEVAELISFPAHVPPNGGTVRLDIVKNGKTLTILSSTSNGFQQPLPSIVVAGPATFSLRSANAEGNFATFRITPEAFPPDRTLIVPPGTNQTRVVLECSTNLVVWTTTTNGLYGPSEGAKFFRIKMETAR
jgi:hypothetical protein